MTSECPGRASGTRPGTAPGDGESAVAGATRSGFDPTHRGSVMFHLVSPTGSNGHREVAGPGLAPTT
ncbi:hypothetical protein GCM10027194_16190 [Thalassiella azotivora]